MLYCQPMPTTAGRPRSFDEGAVLDRAVDLFWRQGFRTTTTRDLETSLGLSQSSLYNAFGSKRGLFVAALDRYEQMTVASLIEPLESCATGLDALHQFLAALAEWVTGNGRGGCMLINVMAEDGGESTEITTRTAAYRQRVRDALRDALSLAADRGEMAPEAIDLQADLLFAGVLGINIAARGGSAPEEIGRLLAAAHHAIDSWRT